MYLPWEDEIDNDQNSEINEGGEDLGRGEIIGTHVGNDNISLYIKGLSSAPAASGLTVQIGTEGAVIQSSGTVEKDNLPLRTLIMIDNSFSIKADQRKQIETILLDVISNRMDGEAISIGTFSEDYRQLCDYTADYSQLKDTVLGLKYYDQETYLTDVLYELLNGDKVPEEDALKRIIIISDGVDNKPIGYTKEELYSYINVNPMPIITIGCRERDNETMLKDMFALSRITGGESYVLDDIADSAEVLKSLSAYKDVVRLVIKPESRSMDGGIKAVKISYGDHVISRDVRMPQIKIEEPPVPAKEVVNTSNTKPQPVREPEPEKGITPVIIVIIVVSVILLVVILTIIIFSIVKGKPPKDDALSLPDDEEDDEGTVMLGGDQKVYQIILEDLDNPARRFTRPLSAGKAIIIGRVKDTSNPQKPDINLNYDSTVSKRHCEIGGQGGRFFVKDTNSANGTYLNQKKITAPTPIISGNVLRVGTTRFRIDIR